MDKMTKYYLGVDLGGTNIKAGLFDEDFQTVEKLHKPTHEEEGPTAVLNRIWACCQELMAAAKIQADDILAAGFGIPGQMDVEKGISIFSPNFTDWQDIPVAKWLHAKLGKPVFIDNDVRVNLYGEMAFGAGRGHRNVVLVTIGTGLGAAILINGQVLYGASNSVGEIGHMNMYRHGRPCACGSSGCLGRYVSARGIVKTMQEKLADGQTSMVGDWMARGQELTTKLISEAVAQGDVTAIDVFKETGELLGFGLGNVINLYNPEELILGGGVAAAGEPLFKYTRDTLAHHSLPVAREACQVSMAQLGDEAGMVGATVYAGQKISASGSTD
ncbi:glucokinase [Lentilactobacillus otakiensis DSM 19908 = JCM 15040]|nr:glucokinase [Lentilactobacillus otakiensis DSM 19908 = JCM 15040]